MGSLSQWRSALSRPIRKRAQPTAGTRAEFVEPTGKPRRAARQLLLPEDWLFVVEMIGRSLALKIFPDGSKRDLLWDVHGHKRVGCQGLGRAS